MLILLQGIDWRRSHPWGPRRGVWYHRSCDPFFNFSTDHNQREGEGGGYWMTSFSWGQKWQGSRHRIRREENYLQETWVYRWVSDWMSELIIATNLIITLLHAYINNSMTWYRNGLTPQLAEKEKESLDDRLRLIVWLTYSLNDEEFRMNLWCFFG